jgi:ATP/maltotriose-dependent transcriptional regulator MalT/DNA-binding SARP family transcriptional activator
MSAIDPIDTGKLEFLSYAPPIEGRRLGMEELSVSAEAEIGERTADETAHVRSSFPLQQGKIRRPLLPEETLRRDRLLRWLESQGNRTVVYIVAEAGFGKTTLVADFARRSRLRTFWYRLDEGDTDGLVFLRYLIASCRSVNPRLLSRAASLLSDSATGPVQEETILEAVLAEMDSLGEVPSALVLEDFHTVEATPSIREVVDRLISRVPKGLAVLILSRRTPPLAVAGLRARGEFAELSRDELRFDETETARLFSESYQHPLESDVVRDLQARTEGWAASLQLVKTAVEGRSPRQIRAFVSSLSGAESSLYDYLAEEVVGELQPDLRLFLMRVVLLEEIDPESAAIAADVPLALARRLIAEAQRLGLLSRVDGIGGSWRAHPLVCDFLLSHLEAEVGEAGVADLHRHLALLLEPRSWRLAARHWAAAGEAQQVRRVICAAVPTIIGTGDFAAAGDLISLYPDPNPNPWYEIIRSRQLAAEGRHEEALTSAHRAEVAGANFAVDDPSLSIASALNLLFLGFDVRETDVRDVATAELSRSGDPEMLSIAKSAQLLFQASEEGSLDALAAELRETARLNRSSGHPRHEAISLLNLSLTECVRGNHGAAAAAGLAALQLLVSTGVHGDLAAAHANTARALAHWGEPGEWDAHAASTISETQGSDQLEPIAEVAELQAMYGDPANGLRIMRSLVASDPRNAENPYCRQVEARLEMQCGNVARASELLPDSRHLLLCPGFRSALLSLGLQIRACARPDDPSLVQDLEKALSFAERQQAWFWWKTIRLTQALVSTKERLVVHLRLLEPTDAAYLSIQAESVVRRLADLDDSCLGIVRAEAERRPERWRWALRQMLSDRMSPPTEVRRCAALLDLVGDADDVALLRSIARRKSLRAPDAGRTLIRRLAPPAYIEDLGRVTIRVGQRVIPGTDVRRKVLSLLAYLLTRPQFTASREQVVEALWPEMEPEPGANSLNQTAYFLRRVFEPPAEDDTTAGYLSSRGDLIWLDPELVQSHSSECLRLIAAARRDPSPELIASLAESYTGRFAIDFMYDEWAAPFRDMLHASYLDRIERAVLSDTKSGLFDRALSVAQQALQADPEAEQIELCLLRLYRLTGAHAAAAEQYIHYSSVLREQLGVEPPPLESI